MGQLVYESQQQQSTESFCPWRKSGNLTERKEKWLASFSMTGRSVLHEVCQHMGFFPQIHPHTDLVPKINMTTPICFLRLNFNSVSLMSISPCLVGDDVCVCLNTLEQMNIYGNFPNNKDGIKVHIRDAILLEKNSDIETLCENKF